MRRLLLDIVCPAKALRLPPAGGAMEWLHSPNGDRTLVYRHYSPVDGACTFYGVGTVDSNGNASTVHRWYGRPGQVVWPDPVPGFTDQF